MEAGVCGLPGRSAAGHVEVASPLLSDTATAPGTDLASPHLSQRVLHVFIIELH